MSLKQSSDISEKQQPQQDSQAIKALELVRVHVKNQNRGIQDVSLEVPSSWRFGQLKRVLATYHSQLAGYSHTQLQFMHAGRIVDDRNTLGDQLSENSQRNATSVFWNMQNQQNQIGQEKQAQLSLNLLIEQQVSDHAVELDSKRKILDQKIVAESIWRQFSELIQPFASVPDSQQLQHLERRRRSRVCQQQKQEFQQQFPLFHPTFQSILETKLQAQKAETDKKLADAAALERNQNIQQLQQQQQQQQIQIQGVDIFGIVFFLGLIIYNFKGMFLYAMLGVAIVYAVVKYQEFQHKFEQKQINRNNNANNNIQENLHNNNNNPILGVINVNNNNLPNPPPITAATNPTDGISQGNNQNILDSTAPAAENVTNINFTDGSASQNNDNPGINNNANGISKENNPNLVLQDHAIISDTSNASAASKDNSSSQETNPSSLIGNQTDSGRQTQEEQARKEINMNADFGEVTGNTTQFAGISQPKPEQEKEKSTNATATTGLSSPTISQKRRRPKGILLFILRVKEFIVCLLMSLFPPWHIELYNKGEQYEEEKSEESVEQEENNKVAGLLERFDNCLANKIKELQQEKQLIEEKLQSIQNSINNAKQDKESGGLGDLTEGQTGDEIRELQAENEGNSSGLESYQKDQEDIQKVGDKNGDGVVVDEETKENQ